jgi:hypothetical protein
VAGDREREHRQAAVATPQLSLRLPPRHRGPARAEGEMSRLARLWRLLVSIERPESAQTNDDARTVREDARVAYKAAIDLWITSSNQLWARFNVMLFANSILLAITVQFAVENKLALPGLWYLLYLPLPVLGIALCCMWFAVISRGLQYQNYYVKAARDLEKAHLSPTVTVVSMGERAGACMKGFGRLPAHRAARYVVFLVMFLHGVVACWIVYRFTRPLDFGGV